MGSLVEATSQKRPELLTEPVDVVIITMRTHLLPQIENLLASHNLTYLKATPEHFADIHAKLALVGTVLIDAGGMVLAQQKNLRWIVEALETENIGTILINSWTGFSPQCTLLSTLYTATLEELWGRISANIAFHRHALRQKPPCTATQDINLQKAMLADMMSEQLRVAGRVQRDFLPAHLPSTAGLAWQTIFEPAEWVSGDIYDIARLDEEHIGFYVADAVGHSLPAALLTIFIKQAMTMRETIGNTYSVFEPLEVMENLNRRMSNQRLSGCQFVTCCYCLLNTKTRELTFSRGGHPYPIIISKDGTCRQLQIRGPLIGVFEEAQFFQETIQLESGDKVLLYSDGAEPLIGKLDSAAGFKYTPEFAALAAKPLKEAFATFNVLLKQRTPGTPEFDDVTVVGLEVA